MKAREFLMEGTDNLYHATGLGAALDIIKSGKFELTSAEGNKSEMSMMPPGYNFYLSTTRSKIGDYTIASSSDHGVVFNLDGRWINQRYPVKPVDYWERMWLNNPEGRTSEAEDRVFSKTHTMPATPIQSVHLLFKEDTKMTQWNHFARQLLIAAKTRNIPIYLYDDKQSYMLQDTRKAMTVADAKSRLTGPSPKNTRRSPKVAWMQAWLELYYKNNIDDVSERTYKKAKEINSYAGSSNEDFGFKNDMVNARAPSSLGRKDALSILKIMQKEKVDAIGFIHLLQKKWKPITAQRAEEERAEWLATKEKREEE